MSLICADARQIALRDGCVQCVVTSPPYFGLRDYGVAGQIGLEPTPDAYVATLVDVFREVRRVLKEDGVVWLNLGDSYAMDAKWGGVCGWRHSAAEASGQTAYRRRRQTGLKAKDLIGIPWRVAFALQSDGWYLRSDVIWAKPNPMPESVTDRPTKSHEYLFLLAKSEQYYYDVDAIREAHTHQDAWRNSGDWAKSIRDAGRQTDRPFSTAHSRPNDYIGNINGRNKRTVWTIPTRPYADAHFATMPEALVEPCILAGSRFGDLVFDPFIGSGTVGAVAERLGRRWVGTDLNPAYHRLAKDRTRQKGLKFSEGVAGRRR